MIKIEIGSIESLQGTALRRIGGMFDALAKYVDGLDMLAATPAPAPTEPAASEMFGKPAQAVSQVGPVEIEVPSFSDVQPNGIEVDSAGVIWDGRIHAATRAKVADGTWRQRRNVDPVVVDQVMAEIKQVMAVPVPAPFVPAVVPAAPVETITIPAPPGVIPAPGVAPTVSHTDANSFLKLMSAITAAYATKQLTQEQIAAAVNKSGIPSLPMLAGRPDLIPSVALELGIML